MSDAYGELHELNEAGTIITIAVAGTFVQLTTASAGLGGPSDLVQVDAANNQLVIGANGAGVYHASVAVSMQGNLNSLKEGAIFVNGIRQTKLELNRHIGASMDAGSANISGLVTLAAGDTVDLRFTANGNGDTVELFHVDLVLKAVVRAVT